MLKEDDSNGSDFFRADSKFKDINYTSNCSCHLRKLFLLNLLGLRLDESSKPIGINLRNKAIREKAVEYISKYFSDSIPLIYLYIFFDSKK